jgi:Rnl2 family RNA ligase
MNFTKYNSIENTYKEKVVSKIYEEGYANMDWVVTDKLDGANFSFITDGTFNILPARRSGICDETFFNCKSVIDKYSSLVLDTFIKINDELFNGKLEYLQFYGELIGDGINNRVKYCKGREFFLYDIKYKTTYSPNTSYLDFTQVTHYTDGKFNIPCYNYFSNLKGALEFCSRSENSISHVPKLLNNEYKYLLNNTEEGFVLKPNEARYFSNGERVILKHKNTKFLETKQKEKTVKTSLNYEQQAQLDFLLNFVTESRFYSVISKEGNLTEKEFGKLIKLYSQDVYKDAEVVKVDKQVSKIVNTEIVKLIKPLFFRMV